MNRRRAGIHTAAALALLLVASCGGGGGRLPPDPLAFFFAGTTPLAGATGVPLDQTVTVVFNKGLDVGTVDANTLTIESSSGITMAGTLFVVQDGDDDTLRWIPVHNLGLGEQHTCTIDPALRSIDGEALEGPGCFQFVTTAGGGGDGLPTRDQMRPALDQLNVGRQGHTATVLDDQRVLIVGGFTLLSSTTDSAEVFLEGLERFVELDATLGLGRASHTATKLPDGRVLIAGGWIDAGGKSATTATAEIFDPVTNTFSPTGTMTTQRTDHAAAPLPGGLVLITGGSRLEGTFLRDLDSAEVYDPATGMFSALDETMTHTRATHGMVDNGRGQIVLGGGSDTDRRHDWYVKATGVFEDLGQGVSDQGRFGPAVAAFDSGGVVIAGGDLLGTVMYVSSAGFVQNTGSGLNRPRSYATAVRIKRDQILVAGGIDFSRNGFIEASCDVIVEGGIGGSNTFASEVRLGTGMAFHTATVLPSGNILFCGGQNEDGAMPNKTAAYIFDVR